MRYKVKRNMLLLINKLTSLEGSPEYVGGKFACYLNKLKTLKGAPKYIGGEFDCTDNDLSVIDDGPEYVGEDYNAMRQKKGMRILDIKKYTKVDGRIYV